VSEIEKLREEIRGLIIWKDDLQNHVDKSRWRETQAIRERDEARRIACFMMTRSECSIKAAKAFGWDCFKEDRA
jgi:hypothetical protein